MMNKKFGMFLVMVLCAVLVTGCGKKEETPVVDNNVETEVETPATDDKQDEVADTENNEVVEDNTEDQQPAEDTEAPVEEETEEPEVEENTESNTGSQEPETEQPEVEDTQTPEEQEPEVEEPVVDAPAASVDLTEIFEAVKGSYEYFAADMLMNASNPDELAMIDMMIWVPNENGDGVGLSADLYDEYVAAVPMISFNPDFFVAVKAKDGKLNDVLAYMESYKAFKADPMGNYPANLPRYQATRIETYGDYVFCYTVGMPNDTEEDEAALLEYYNEENQIASDVIAGFFK